MIVYLDTSAVLRVLLRQEKPLPEWGRWQRAYASEMLFVEARRAFDRLRLAGALDDGGVIAAQRALQQVEAAVGRIRLGRMVLRRAAQPMGVAVRTLDAIHLASAVLFQERRGETIVFATHDVQQARGAQALGLDCIGV
ncbi:MAG TPA: PIN domain-containing protein [Terriglobales bacterium]|nr:PIN domain-containing protein [Terriglobales bacterium]